MKRVGTGESTSPALRSVSDAALYVLELVGVAASYFGLAEAALMLPSINPAATPSWPPSGFALALLLLRGYRIWPAILLGSFFPTP
jgi:integral membrane sensor domain MASE1